MKPVLLVLTQTHNHWGGIEAWMSEVLPHLEQSGWDIHYGLALGRHHNQPHAFLAHHPYMRNVHLMDGRVATPGAREQAVRALIRRIKPDAVMPLAIGDAYPALARERAEGSKARVLAPLHSLHTGTLADLVSYRDLIDTIVAVSGLQYKWLERSLKFASERVMWVRNGVARAEVPRKSRDNGPLRVGYVGRFENGIKRVNDVGAIVRACAAGGIAMTMDFVGDGPDRDALQAGLQNVQREVPARFLGFCERAVLYREIYPRLDVLLLASVTEGSPLVLAEAMHNGVVPVSSEYFGFAAEGLLEPGGNCLSFPVGDIDRAAAKIGSLARSEELLSRLSARAHESVAPRYDRSAMLQGWRDAFARMLDLPARPPCAPPARAEYGRLDRWRVPAPLANWIRRHSQTPSVTADGFVEWPGSVCEDAALLASIDNSLRAIESECSALLRVDERTHA